MPANSPNLQPLFTYTPIISCNVINGWNPSRGGNAAFPTTGIFTTIASGNNFGTRIEFLKLLNTGTSTASVVRFFIDNSKCVPNPYSNTGIYLMQEVATSAVTASTTVAAYTTELVRTDGRPFAILPSGVLLVGTCSVNDPNGSYLVQAHGADF